MKKKDNLQSDDDSYKEPLINKIKRFFRNYPFISWNIIALITFFIHWFLTLIFFFIGLGAWLKRRGELREQERQQMIKEAEVYIEEVKEREALPTIQSTIFLKEKEQAFLEEQTSLSETKAVRKHSGGTTGAGMRVAKGIYIGGSKRGGSSESHQEWRTIDKGKLIITSKRIVFRGDKENRVIPLDKLISVDVALESIELATESKKKTMMFSVKNGYIWGAVINIVKRVDDPLDLDDLELNIQFE